MRTRYLFAAAFLAALALGAGSEPPAYSCDGQTPAATAPDPTVVVEAARPITWSKSFETAKRLAKADQLIVVDVSTDWCAWCRYMETKVYPDASVREFAAGNVFVRFDPRDGAEGQQFAKKQKVNAYPTIFVFSANGKLIRKQVGAFDGPSPFLAWLHTASARR